MINLNLSLKNIDWARVAPYIIIVVLSFIIFRSYGDNKEILVSKANLEKQLKISEIKQRIYVSRINVLNDSLIALEGRKQQVKTKIVTVIKEVKAEESKVNDLNTKGIANYYQKRYSLPVIITKYGVSLSDSIGKKSIKELIQKDGLEKELGLTQEILKISDLQSGVKDTIISSKDSIIKEKEIIIDSHLELENVLNKSIKSEKTKKTIWQIATGAAAIGAGFLLIK